MKIEPQILFKIFNYNLLKQNYNPYYQLIKQSMKCEKIFFK